MSSESLRLACPPCNTCTAYCCALGEQAFHIRIVAIELRDVAEERHCLIRAAIAVKMNAGNQCQVGARRLGLRSADGAGDGPLLVAAVVAIDFI